MRRIREPAVAELFYPGDPQALREQVERCLAGAGAGAAAPIPKAIIAPHAGLVYSGSVAAHAYARLVPAATRISRVVLLGPSHRVHLSGLALPDADAFRTPLGLVEIDPSARAQLQDLDQVSVCAAAHAAEHSLEVQLPFLQQVLSRFVLVPLVAGDASPAAVAEVLDRLWDAEQTLIVVSSDLSHYHDYTSARRIDAATTAAIEALELDALGPHQACGCVPVRGLLHSARARGMRATTLCVANSGDTAGPRDRVVGYGAWALH